jgi:hypothetical protein
MHKYIETFEYINTPMYYLLKFCFQKGEIYLRLDMAAYRAASHR